MSGPCVEPGSSPGAGTSFFTAATSLALNASCTASCTRRRFAHTQVWPVFRYFDALDELDRVAIARQQARVAHLIEIAHAGEGTIEERIERLVQQRMRLFGAIAPVARVSRLRAPFHPVVARELEEGRRFLRRQAERQFEPELSGLPREWRASTAAALDVLTSFESYELLVGARRMSARQAGEALRHALRALLNS